MPVTMKQVAELCGVSLGTVTRALNGKPGINAQTKDKILRVSAELGYRPHHAARSLRIGKSMTIGIVVYDLDNRFFAQLVNVLVSVAKEAGYFFYLTISKHSLEEERACIEHLVGLNVDGILIVPTNKGNEFVQFLKSVRVPLVAIGNRLSPSIPFVGIDGRAALRQAVAEVAHRGYERVVFLSPPLSYRDRENISEVEERYEGYREGLKEHGLEGVVLKDKAFADSLVTACQRTGKRTAVVCTSDSFALEALLALRRAGIRVPEDVGLVGFDDIDTLKYVTPQLTTIAYPLARVATSAFHVLQQLMAGQSDPKTPLIEAELVLRDSL